MKMLVVKALYIIDQGNNMGLDHMWVMSSFINNIKVAFLAGLHSARNNVNYLLYTLGSGLFLWPFAIISHKINLHYSIVCLGGLNAQITPEPSWNCFFLKKETSCNKMIINQVSTDFLCCVDDSSNSLNSKYNRQSQIKYL